MNRSNQFLGMLYSPELNPAPDKFKISTRQAQSSRTSGTPERGDGLSPGLRHLKAIKKVWITKT